MSDVTIQDVARAAGVSPASVSNLLNGRTNRMRADTRSRIEAVISELRYRPNPIARQLKTGRAPMLGLLVPTVANPFYGEMAVAVERAAKVHGYHILLCNTFRDAAREVEFADQLFAMGVRGLIMSGSPAMPDEVRNLTARGISIVAFDIRLADPPHPGIDVVTLDNAASTRIATEHLVAEGHRRIAYAGAPVMTASHLDRLRGYREALARAGLEEGPLFLGLEGGKQSRLRDPDLGALGKEAGRRLAKADPRPTAIVAQNDMIAIGLISGLGECGLDVPGDVSVVGLDDIHISSLIRPGLTTIRQPLARMTELALDRLMERLRAPETAPSEYLMPPELVLRGSTAPPRR